MNEYIIDLKEITEKGKEKISSLGLRENGIAAREALNLDNIEDNYDKIIFKIPPYVSGFHSSFFGGLFSRSIDKLNHDRNKFIEKYCFETESKEVKQQIERNIISCFINTDSDRL